MPHVRLRRHHGGFVEQEVAVALLLAFHVNLVANERHVTFDVDQAELRLHIGHQARLLVCLEKVAASSVDRFSLRRRRRGRRRRARVRETHDWLALARTIAHGVEPRAERDTGRASARHLVRNLLGHDVVVHAVEQHRQLRANERVGARDHVRVVVWRLFATVAGSLDFLRGESLEVARLQHTLVRHVRLELRLHRVDVHEASRHRVLVVVENLHRLRLGESERNNGRVPVSDGGDVPANRLGEILLALHRVRLHLTRGHSRTAVVQQRKVHGGIEAPDRKLGGSARLAARRGAEVRRIVRDRDVGPEVLTRQRTRGRFRTSQIRRVVQVVHDVLRVENLVGRRADG